MHKNALLFPVVLISTVAVIVLMLLYHEFLVPLLIMRQCLVALAAISFFAIGVASAGLFSAKFRMYSGLIVCGFLMYWIGFFLISEARKAGEFGYGLVGASFLYMCIPGFVLMVISAIFLICASNAGWFQKFRNWLNHTQ